MAKILLGLADEAQAQRAVEAFKEGRHEAARLEGLQPENGPSAADILKSQADLVVLDFLAEDAASVKLMQTVSDAESQNRPAFIFIEGPGPKAPLEVMLMALNEGAQAFLPADFQAAALLNYAERALSGPGRLRPKVKDPNGADEALEKLEEALGQARTKELGFKKLIGHLLSTSASAQNRKVLLVSDSPYQLEMLKKILEDHSFQVVTAANPADGLKAVQSEAHPRIIVSDLELEGQTGVEFCQTVKFTHKIVPCFFVICTANQDKIAKVMSPGNGVDDCLLKPSGPNDTMEFISRVAMGLLL